MGVDQLKVMIRVVVNSSIVRFLTFSLSPMCWLPSTQISLAQRLADLGQAAMYSGELSAEEEVGGHISRTAFTKASSQCDEILAPSSSSGKYR